jgi:hypothetical protein
MLDGDAEQAWIAGQAEFLGGGGAGGDVDGRGPPRHAERVVLASDGCCDDRDPVDQQVQIGVVGQRQAGAGAGLVQQGPPVSTGAQGSFGGWSQPLLAFWKSQRLPSSR